MARRMIAGFLAGASGLAGLLLLPILLLVGSGFLSLIRELAIGQQGDVGFWSALATSIVRSLRSLPGYFWSARWGMVALGLLGILLALLESWKPHIQRRWRDQVGLVVTAATVSGLIFGGIYAYRAVLYRLVADRPELSNQQEVVLTSTGAQLALGALTALALTYLIWASWRFWYERWSTVLRLSQPATSVAAPTRPQAAATDDWRTYQQRMAQLRRDPQSQVESAPAPVANQPAQPGIGPHILAGLVLTSVLLYFLARTYDDIGPGLLNAGMWVTADQRANAAPLSFPREPARIVVSNTGGSGTVGLRLTEQGETVREVGAMRLPGNPRTYAAEEIQLDDLPAGEYTLEATLQDGDGGLLNYAALYGGGLPGRLLAAALGLAAGMWAALATIGMLEILAGRGYFGR